MRPGLHDAAATMTIGLLAIAVVALPRTVEADRDLLGPMLVRAVRLPGRWAVGWALLGAGVLLLTYSDVVGRGLARPGALDRLEPRGGRPGGPACGKVAGHRRGDR